MNVAPDFNNHLWSIDLFRSIIIDHWRFLLLTIIIQHKSLVSSKLDIMYLRYLQSIIRKNKFSSSQQNVATTLPRPTWPHHI